MKKGIILESELVLFIQLKIVFKIFPKIHLVY